VKVLLQINPSHRPAREGYTSGYVSCYTFKKTQSPAANIGSQRLSELPCQTCYACYTSKSPGGGRNIFVAFHSVAPLPPVNAWCLRIVAPATFPVTRYTSCYTFKNAESPCKHWLAKAFGVALLRLLHLLRPAGGKKVSHAQARVGAASVLIPSATTKQPVSPNYAWLHLITPANTSGLFTVLQFG
jgi:hypothetical protein